MSTTTTDPNSKYAPEGEAPENAPAEDPPPADELGLALLVGLQKLMSLIPTALLVRPAYPAIINPRSGDAVRPGGLTVTVTSNRPDLAHVVAVLNADTLQNLNQGPVVFGAGNQGTATVTVPPPPPTNYILDCWAPNDPAGNHSRVLITSSPPGGLTAGTLDANVNPGMYAIGKQGVFTAQPSGGTLPYSYEWQVTNTGGGWVAGGVTFGRTFNAAGAFGVLVRVTDATGAQATSMPKGPYTIV